MLITKEIIDRGKSSRGGWNKKQLNFLGEFDFKKGWFRRIIGKDIPEEDIKKFIELKDAHFSPEKLTNIKNKKKISFEYCPTNIPYKDQYTHPNWQKVRLVVLKKNSFSCIECKSKDKTLHVHHLKYNKNGFIWEVPLWYLVVLCEDCHSEEHGRDLTINKKTNGTK